MIAELRQKSQVTIPKEIVAKLGLSEGDKLDILNRTVQYVSCRSGVSKEISGRTQRGDQ